MSVSEERLAAYADGELEGAERAEVEAAIAADPALAARLAAHRALKARLAAHYAPLAEEAVPDRLAALLAVPPAAPAEVVSLAAARQKRGLAPAVRRWAPIAGPALAASLILALWQPWQAGVPEGYARGELAAALDTQLAGDQPSGAPTRILLSFARTEGDLCRAYRSGAEGGIACRDAAGWKIERRFALDGAPAGQFRQAGSEADLMAAAQDMAAGGALDAEGEAAARKRGWTQP
ncbi:zf-HC2 domain-containing protein [Erythrobacter sp. NE805]|uniref:zf-HC2 domain-containing protein n=1 Tax=Erythrobacter sp. NE805 TaxID=3389875 RepID=UPI00396B378A